jgi:hypothetical protein
MKIKKPYNERSDIEKIQSNWKKIEGLIEREEWSSAIVRAATATEIASNLVIRIELIELRGIDDALVNHFLKWANGVQGKFEKLIIPLVIGKNHEKEFKHLKSKVYKINRIRNEIVHSGKFTNKNESIIIIEEAKEIINSMVFKYHSDFKLN